MTKSNDDKAQIRKPRAFKINAENPRAKSTNKNDKKPIKTEDKPRSPKKIEQIKEVIILPDEMAENRDQNPQNNEGDFLTPPPLKMGKKSFSFAKVFFAALAALLSLTLWLFMDDLVRTLFERNTWLGFLALALTGAIVISAFGIIVREIFAISRLNSIKKLRNNFEKAHQETVNIKAQAQAQKALKDLASLFQNRQDTAPGFAVLEAQKGEILDAKDWLKIAELEIIAPLDASARKMVLESAKRTSIVTAISPKAIVDLAYVLMENFRLIRKLSQHFGGRPGVLGFWRLTHTVLTHLALTGSIAVGDSILQQFIGHGVAAKLSARFGEGVLNGLLTARVGIAAMDVCRPAPFHYSQRPSASDFLSDLLARDENKK